jgi:hypothetical protein
MSQDNPVNPVKQYEVRYAKDGKTELSLNDPQVSEV